MPKTETFLCEACDETVDQPVVELAVITIARPQEPTVTSYVHNECLNEAMEGNEFLESVILHD